MPPVDGCIELCRSCTLIHRRCLAADVQAADRGAHRWHMARRELVRRLNLDVAPAERPDYDTETVDALVDWICETETLDGQRQRITEVLERLRLGGTDAPGRNGFTRGNE